MRWFLGLLNDDTRPWDHEAVELAIVEYTRTLGSNEHTAYVWEEARGADPTEAEYDAMYRAGIIDER